MSEVSVAPAKTLRQGLCLECGAVRTAKARYLGRGTRTLRCEGCQRGTAHAAVNWDGHDVREEANLKQSQGNTDALRELEALMQLFRSCSIDVLISEPGVESGEADPLGGLVDVVRWKCDEIVDPNEELELKTPFGFENLIGIEA